MKYVDVNTLWTVNVSSVSKMIDKLKSMTLGELKAKFEGMDENLIISFCTSDYEYEYDLSVSLNAYYYRITNNAI